MTHDEVNDRMAELARCAARLAEGDPALAALLAELEALSRILPASGEPDRVDEAAEAMFDNLPV